MPAYMSGGARGGGTFNSGGVHMEINVAREGRNDSHYGQVRTASGLNIIAGIWTIISPWVYGFFNGTGSVWNNVIVGIVIAIFAAIRFFGAASAVWLSWINALLGIWLILSPWIYGYTTNTGRMWNSIIVGIIVLVLSVWSAVATNAASRV
jgi:hypothetical protein